MFKIAIDLDDTLCFTANKIRRKAREFHVEILKRKLKYRKLDNCINYYYFADELGWDKNDTTKFFEWAYPYYLQNVKPKKNMIEAIKKLYLMGCEVYIVTARRISQKIDVKELTTSWANKYGLIYKEIIIGTKNKAEILAKLKCDMFIDDSIENCLDVKKELKNVKVCLFSTKYNAKCTNENVIRVHNGTDVIRIVKEFLRS